MPNADGRRELPRRRNSGSPTSENSNSANFVLTEFSEVRYVLATPSNGKDRPFGRCAGLTGAVG
jgi:hypothetical protein